MPRRLFALALAAGIAGCQIAPPAPPAALERPITERWRAIARPADIDRIERLAGAWEAALAAAQAAGQGARLTAGGAALDPAAALSRAAPPPGSYQCRLTRLGAGPGRRTLLRYPVYFCYVGVEGALLSFAKQTGAERLAGYIFEDSDARLILLGATSQGREAAPGYGADEAREVIGVVERVGAMRYRILFPWPRGGARLDVIELAPVAPALE